MAILATVTVSEVRKQPKHPLTLGVRAKVILSAYLSRYKARLLLFVSSLLMCTMGLTRFSSAN